MAQHRLTRRTSVRGIQLVGLAAALAAVAGSTAVGITSSSGPATAGTTTTSNQVDAMTTARIQREQLASRDMARRNLSLESARKAQAANQAKLRAAKLAATANLAKRRALALSAAKALAAKRAAAEKAAAGAKRAATARAAAAAKAAAIAKAKAKAAPKVVLPTTGYRLTARFGQAGGRWSRNHTGLDFAAPIGTPVRSVMAGKVTQAAFAGAYGRQVKVRHADGTVTSYSHMSKFTVSVGQSVPAAGQVGAIGVTGNTTGPHLHFEVLPGGGQAIDPEPWLRQHGVNP